MEAPEPTGAERTTLEPADIEVLFQDEHFVLVNKPSGYVVHRGWARDRVVVQTLVRDRLGQRVDVAHRLDRGTSGVLALALHKGATRALTELFATGQVEKRYLALVRGTPPEAGTIDHAIPRTAKGPRVPAVTDFERLQVVDQASLVRAMPKTGRLHQVRRHLKHLGHPVVNDRNHGRGWHNEYFRTHYGLDRMALHARAVAFEHPITGERIEVVAPARDLQAPFSALGIDPACYL
jgi:tRNA pseudouridine65 synthase